MNTLSEKAERFSLLLLLATVPGTHLYTWVKRDKVEKSSSSKKTTRRRRLEPRTSGSRVRGVNRSATHASTFITGVRMQRIVATLMKLTEKLKQLSY